MREFIHSTPAASHVRRPTRRVSLSMLLAVAGVVTLSPRPTIAQTYPERPIKIVVPFSAGGPTDVAARLIAQSLSSKLAQNVVVENVAGAGGRIGAKAVATASPDGYTLLLGGTNVNALFGAIYKNLGFDPIASFAPVAAICVDSIALAVNPAVPAQTVQELVVQAKNNPGKLRFGAPPGIYTHFAGEYFKVKTGTDIQFVPYRGGAPAITDLLGGHIEIVFNPKSTLLTHFLEGKLKALAVSSETRWPELPQVPTMAEAGVTGFPTEVWFGLLAPAGTPAPVIERLNRAINEGLASSDVAASLAKLGVQARGGSPEDFAAALSAQARTWRTVIEETGIKLE
jgi:tripartite-type tricarboxylate transporter receptor subunit TctC